MNGWVKSFRCMLDNPVVCKDAEYFAVWNYLLLMAAHKEQDMMFNGERITLVPGQLITGRKAISGKFNIAESKVQRILKKLESEHQIEQQTSTKNRLISIVNWDKYQCDEQQTEQQVNNNRTTSEQQVNTNKNDKKDKNDKKSITRARDLTEFSGLLQQVIKDWLSYKTERGEEYSSVGFGMWLDEVRANLKKYSEKHISEVIRRTMAKEYRSVVWDWLAEYPRKPKEFESETPVNPAEVIGAEEQREKVQQMIRTRGGHFEAS